MARSPIRPVEHNAASERPHTRLPEKPFPLKSRMGSVPIEGPRVHWAGALRCFGRGLTYLKESTACRAPANLCELTGLVGPSTGAVARMTACASRIADHAARGKSNSPHAATTLAPPRRTSFTIVVSGEAWTHRPPGQASSFVRFQAGNWNSPPTGQPGAAPPPPVREFPQNVGTKTKPAGKHPTGSAVRELYRILN